MRKETRLRKLQWLIGKCSYVSEEGLVETVDIEDNPIRYECYSVRWPHPYDGHVARIRKVDGELMDFVEGEEITYDFSMGRELGNPHTVDEMKQILKIDRRIKWLVESIGASRAVAEAARPTRIAKQD